MSARCMARPLLLLLACAALPTSASAQTIADDSWLAWSRRPSIFAETQGADPASQPAATSQQAGPQWPLPGGAVLAWDGLPVIRSPDSRVKVAFGGEAEADFGWINGHGLGPQLGEDLDNAFEWRRLRPNVVISIDDVWIIKLQPEFAGSDITLEDVYVRRTQVPVVGNVTVGHMKEPFGMDDPTANTDTLFVERSLPQVFSPDRNFGVRLNNTAMDERMTWAVGAFKNTETEVTPDNGQGQAWAFTGRTTALPYYENAGADLVHLGGAYSFRLPREPISFSQKPEADFVPDFAQTGDIDAHQVQLAGAEAAWQHGPLWVQSEYVGAMINASQPSFLYLHGGYVQAGYVLTGEHRPYDRKLGVFGYVKPAKSVLAGGIGAWEIGARYSFLNFENASLPTTARQVQDMTLGLNWYVSENMRICWDYIRSYVEGPGVSGAADIFVLRLQVSF